LKDVWIIQNLNSLRILNIPLSPKQFIDGIVDARPVKKLAQTLALLHCSDFDPEFNNNVRPCMRTIFPAMKEKLQELVALPEGEGGRVAELAKSYGGDVCDLIIDANLANYEDRDCLVHSDSHAFNILVEAKPEVSTLERFGPNGDVILCDWEMVFAGPIGRDIGLAWVSQGFRLSEFCLSTEVPPICDNEVSHLFLATIFDL